MSQRPPSKPPTLPLPKAEAGKRSGSMPPPPSRPPTPAKVEGKPTRAEESQPKSERPERDASALVGEIVSGRYRIERLIGEGGMGAVYQAEHTHMRKRLAVKILHADMSRMPEVVARFEREAMAAAHIDHPNVAAATDFGKLPDGSFFLVLEYVEGRSLRKAIEREAPFEPARALNIAKQIALALERAHALGIVHRDLKPENVMLVERPTEPDFVKVLDFGIAKVPPGNLGPREAERVAETGVPQKLTQVGMVYGTPEYMPPEQALGQEVDARADLYALGVILFELLTAVRPYEAESKVALLGMQVTAPIPFFTERAPSVRVPPAVETLVRHLLAKEVRDRTSTASQLVADIDRLLAEIGQSHSATGAPGPVAANAAFGPLAVPTPGLPVGLGSSPGSAGTASDGSVHTERAMPVSVSATIRATKHNPNGQMLLWGAGVLGLALLVGTGYAVTRHRVTDANNAADGGALATASDAGSVANGLTGAGTGAGTTGTTNATIDAGAAGTVGDTAAAAPLIAREKDAAAKHHWGDVLEATREILQVDPPEVNDDQLLGDVRNAALDPKFEEAAMGLIVTMGSRGGDVLYDIAYSPWSTSYPHARKRATTLLATPEERTHVSPALDVTLLLRDAAPPCDPKAPIDKSLIARAAGDGDFRTNAVLRPWSSTRGCGAGKSHDCFACLHGDDTLTKTIAAIDARSPDPSKPH